MLLAKESLTIGKADKRKWHLISTPCQYLPWECIKELDRAWAQHQGARQRLLGE